MSKEIKYNYFKIFFFAFVLISISEIIAETFTYKPIIYITKPLIPISLMIIYWIISSVKNKLFFLILFLSSITNLFFIPNSPQMLLYGVISFTVLRILMLVFIFNLVKIEHTLFFIVATLLFLSLFGYLFLESNIPENSFLLLILHNVMIAIFGGIALSNYIKKDNKQNSYLMICSLLFIGLQLIIFIEKYSLQSYTINIFRPIAMILNVLAFYSFYKFVVISEEIKQL